MHRDPTAGKCKFLALGRWRGTLMQEDLPCNFFSLSDHLDMLGVTLKATYMSTRKANGDELQEKIKNVVGPWRAGKFMNLTMRPHSLNCYAFSKLWHRCTSMDLRAGDIVAINKQAKAWLYADLLEKPEELALYRQPKQGGLGLHHVEQRALAHLINSFLETACNTKFRRNQYHQALFQAYVLEDTTMKPAIPPYFKGNFFPTIKRIHESPLNVARISLKDIYRFLMDEITMSEDVSGSMQLSQLRAELAHPANDWESAWQMARQNMLGPSLTTFLFKLLHQILPTAERVSRILPNQSPHCTRCRENPPATETLLHAMFDCQASHAAGVVLLNGLRKFIPNLTPSQVLTLNFNPSEELSFPLVWITAHFLSSIWQLRADKKRVELIKIRTDMEASCRLLRNSRLSSTAEVLSQIF